ncbi:MAG: proline racemase family protein [Desulfobacterales bacterium]|jgi:trans-L-3-hydroxyproline dehydratase|nr:proline racemase family protein [Desulfobacterales bacterium]
MADRTHPQKLQLARMRRWKPPREWVRITTIDLHTGGEPFRVITGGFPEPAGGTILARRRHVRAHCDRLRTALMFEPRGHADMYGCILTPPVTPGADVGVLFMHNEGYSTMCGHGIIALATAVLETGLLRMQAPETTIRIDSPAGLITARARVADGRVESVCFRNVPSFVLAQDEVVAVPGLGRVRCDIAFGGAFYAYVEAEAAGVRCLPEDFRPLIEKGMAIKRAVAAQRQIAHPFEADLGFLYGTIFIGPPQGADAHSRNVCVFAEGEVDRSPTGTGVSGRLAILHARGEIGIGERIRIESIIGSRFSGAVAETTSFGPYPAVIPEVEGAAHITGRHEFVIDPSDPLREGFILR